jgi:hypothetical protein
MMYLSATTIYFHCQARLGGALCNAQLMLFCGHSKRCSTTKQNETKQNEFYDSSMR